MPDNTGVVNNVDGKVTNNNGGTVNEVGSGSIPTPPPPPPTTSAQTKYYIKQGV